MAITSAQIEKAYANINEGDFEIIDAFDIEKRIETIARLYRLTQEQTDAMSMATTMLAMHGANQEDFFSELADVGLTGIQAKELEKEINDVVLDPLRVELEASKAETEPIEATNTDIEIIDEQKPDEVISPAEESVIQTNERNVLAKEDIVIEEETPKDPLIKISTESRDDILAGLENPQKSEGVALDTAPAVVQPTHTTSIPIRPTPIIFETGPMGSQPIPSSPSVPVATTGTPPFIAQVEEIRTETKTPVEAPEGLPVEPDEPTAPIINTIPITTTAPIAPEKKRIENPGPIAIDIPAPVLEKTIPVAPVSPLAPEIKEPPVVVTAPAIEQTPVSSPTTPQEPVFKDIPKVSIVDVGSLAPTQAPAGNPLEQPELLKAAQEHLRQLARERQKGFIAQKMVSTFSLPKTETVVGAAAPKQTDPYKETL